MFLLGAGVGMTMQNLVLIVQNTANPTEMGVASSGVAFFRSLGGTIGVSVMGAALATTVTEPLRPTQGDDHGGHHGPRRRGRRGRRAAAVRHAPAGVARCPTAVRVIVEDIYAQGIAHSFLIAVPFAVHQPHRDHLPAEQAAHAHDDLASASRPARPTSRPSRPPRAWPRSTATGSRPHAADAATGAVGGCRADGRPTADDDVDHDVRSRNPRGAHRGGARPRGRVRRAHQPHAADAGRQRRSASARACCPAHTRCSRRSCAARA